MDNYTYRYPVALTIAGSDSCGGAGIQADLKTFSALGVYGASVITAITVQNTQGVYAIQAVSPEIVNGQIEVVLNDLKVDSIKIGMLYNIDTVSAVADSLSAFSPHHVILDPVMISTSGRKLLEDEAIQAIVNRLFPRITLLTPNTEEATFLTGITIKEEKDIEEAALRLQAMGCRSVLIKGGHLPGETTTDILFRSGFAPVRYEAPTIQTQNTHGTGCTLSSAISAYLSLGYDLEEAIRLAKVYMTDALSSGANVSIGNGNGPVNHFFSPVSLKKIKTQK